jgi:outer membrane lipoprotein-sorting protein
MVLLLTGLLCTSPSVAAETGDKPSAEVARLLEEILASQERTTTLEGRFTQLKTMALFTDPERSAGRFTFRQPDFIRLDYETPSRVILLLHGDHLTTYYPELKEAERFDVRKQKKRVFDHLIGESGIGQLQKNFTIALGSADSGAPEIEVPASGEATHRLHLTPRRRQLKRRIEFIDLWVRASDYAPVQYFIREKSGDTTLFHLEQMVLNGEVPESHFQIDFPDDVKISVRSGKDGEKDEP